MATSTFKPGQLRYTKEFCKIQFIEASFLLFKRGAVRLSLAQSTKFTTRNNHPSSPPNHLLQSVKFTTDQKFS